MPGNKKAAVGEKSDWTKLRTAEEMNSPDYKYSDMTMQALGSTDTAMRYKDYKNTIAVLTEQKDTQKLFDMLVNLKNKINSRTPGGCEFEPDSGVNGVKAVIAPAERSTPEGRAINLILKGGGNALTAMFGFSKIRTAGNGARDTTYKNMKSAGMTGKQFAENVIYGGASAAQAGSSMDVAKNIGDGLAAVVIMNDTGQPEKAEQMLKSYGSTIQKYKTDKEFCQFAVYYMMESFIERQKGLPMSLMTADLQEDLQAAHKYMNGDGAGVIKKMMMAKKAVNKANSKVGN